MLSQNHQLHYQKLSYSYISSLLYKMSKNHLHPIQIVHHKFIMLADIVIIILKDLPLNLRIFYFLVKVSEFSLYNLELTNSCLMLLDTLQYYKELRDYFNHPIKSSHMIVVLYHTTLIQSRLNLFN